jgi:hypothetical protein
VTAISSTGTYGYSQPTDLFILSSAPKPPSVPQNLSMIVNDKVNETNVNIKVSWLPPKRSDLPLTNYKVKKIFLGKKKILKKKLNFFFFF